MAKLPPFIKAKIGPKGKEAMKTALKNKDKKEKDSPSEKEDTKADEEEDKAEGESDSEDKKDLMGSIARKVKKAK